MHGTSSMNPWKDVAVYLGRGGNIPKAAMERLARWHAEDGSPVPDLVTSGEIDGSVFAEAISAVSRWPLFDISSVPLQSLSDIMAQLAIRHRALPITIGQTEILIAVDDPFQESMIEDFRFAAGLPVRLLIVEHSTLAKRLARSIPRSETPMRASRILVQSTLARPESATSETEISTPSSAEAASTLRLVEEILVNAIEERASDIHLEPLAEQLRVRLRMDGLLRETMRINGPQRFRVITRLKVIANLDIAERRVPQDGRMTLALTEGRTVDLRLSSLPTLHGEKLVLRLLDRSRRALTLDELGLAAEQLAAFRAALARPQGMILVTGPTGSGKTVTLYSALQGLNSDEQNLSTVEDPIEIHLEGINQVNVAPHAGMTFASGLRALLRQDPDVIMVGEIRDSETAEMAVKAAQTGHLVLSTLHTNDASQALTRLVSMGVPRYLIAGSVHFVIAQRLLRRLCPHCREPDPGIRVDALAPGSGSRLKPASIQSFRAVGCARCVGGYFGRIAIFETLCMTDALQQLILRNAPAQEIARAAEAVGHQPLRQAGLVQVAQGLTTLAELERIVAS